MYTSRNVIVTSILVFLLGGLNVVAQQKSANLRRERIPVPLVKTDLSGTRAGVKITGVGSNSAAARAGLKYGDVLIAYNKRPITNEDELDAVIRFFQRQFEQTGRDVTAELSLYRGGDLTVRTFRIPIGRLGVYTRDWTFAGALVQEAIVSGDDYVSAEKYLNEAAASGHYTNDQILHMRLLCLNNETDGDKIRQTQVDHLYRKYQPEKLRLFANYDLLYNKRYYAAAAIFERYLKIKPADVSTALTLASCYAETGKYDEAEALVAKVLGRPRADESAASEYELSMLSNIQARIYMGRGQYDRAQESFKKALDQYPDDPYYILAFLYCAARREVSGDEAGDFEAAYKMVSARLEETEGLMGYHVDALRAFVFMKQQQVSSARAMVVKWKDSADARRYIPVFWRSFPDGAEIIKNWNLLMGQHVIAAVSKWNVCSHKNRTSRIEFDFEVLFECG
jgi:tetratricopeptide (TPR) repeat protein